jgi:hypothetical protein
VGCDEGLDIVVGHVTLEAHNEKLLLGISIILSDNFTDRLKEVGVDDVAE